MKGPRRHGRDPKKTSVGVGSKGLGSRARLCNPTGTENSKLANLSFGVTHSHEHTWHRGVLWIDITQELRTTFERLDHDSFSPKKRGKTKT